MKVYEWSHDYWLASECPTQMTRFLITSKNMYSICCGFSLFNSTRVSAKCAFMSHALMKVASYQSHSLWTQVNYLHRSQCKLTGNAGLLRLPCSHISLNIHTFLQNVSGQMWQHRQWTRVSTELVWKGHILPPKDLGLFPWYAHYIKKQQHTVNLQSSISSWPSSKYKDRPETIERK